MKEVEVDDLKAKLKQRLGIEREAFRATFLKVTFFYLIFVHIFSISNIIFYIGLNLYSILCSSLQMTKTVDFEDNMWAQKEFDMLTGSCSYYWSHAAH
jgi:hypothetical protein